MQAPNPIDVQTGLAHYLDVLYKAHKRYYAKSLTNLTPPTFHVSKGGRRFFRVFAQETSGSGRYVVSFVEKATGLIWKADGWKGPALNYPRGNVLDLGNSQKSYEVFGSAIQYAWEVMAEADAPTPAPEETLSAQLVSWLEAAA